MANKKRRKPNRPRPQGAVDTAERSQGTSSTAPRGNGHAGTSARSAARAERKELARRQREEVRKQIRRRERLRAAAWLVGITAIVGVGAFLIFRPDPPAASTEDLPGLLRTEVPWDANAELAADRADAINLPSHGSTLALHNHSNVRVFVDGVETQVPVNVGINGPGEVASLHTHTADGLVHTESSTVAEFTLGQFFDVWGVRLTPTCLGAYCNDAENEIRVFVDGQAFTGDITDVPLDDRSVIVVTYGSEEELPDPIPASFDFDSIQA